MSFSSNPSSLANQLPISVDFPPTFDAFLPIITQIYKRTANAVNSKEGALYERVENASFRRYESSVPNAYLNGYRLLISIPSLPNNATLTVAHNLPVTSSYIWRDIYGAATDTTALLGIPLPYASSTLSLNVSLSVTATFLSITTAADYSSYQGYVVLEYTKAS